MFCMFGLHLEKQPNRFQRMALTHPEQHDLGVGIGDVPALIQLMGLLLVGAQCPYGLQCL